MSAIKLDVSALTNPGIAAKKTDVNFLWAVAQRAGLLVFQPSLGDQLERIDPQSWTTLWVASVGKTHAVETDGSRIFVPIEGTPGVLKVIGADGSRLSSVPAPDGWSAVYTAFYDTTTRRLYVGVGDNPDQGLPGGVYIYDASLPMPALLGKISGPSWNITARGRRVWREHGNVLEAWEISAPGRPVLLGSYTAPDTTDFGDTSVRLQLGNMTVNRSGNRLYAVFSHVSVKTGRYWGRSPAGVMIFDVSGNTPMPLAQTGWQSPTGLWIASTSVALSPDESVLAVSYWDVGVKLYRVTQDQFADLGMVVTAGEARDVFVDNQGLLYVFAMTNLQIIDPASGQLRDVFAPGSWFDGGWRPFRDGSIVLSDARNGDRYVLLLQNGTVTIVTSLAGLSASSWDDLLEDPYLFSATDQGLYIQQIGAFDHASGKYPVTVVGSVNTGQIIALTKLGTVVWALGPQIGVVAIDVSVPSAPRIVFRDTFTFGVNGYHAGIIAAHGRIYAGAGDASLIIYDPTTFRRTGVVPGLNVNFLDKVFDDFLVVANYWYPQPSEGAYVYDLRRNPDAPALVDRFPQPYGNANFRVRTLGLEIYRLPLYGVDIVNLK